MNRKALLAVSLAVLLPLVSYWWVKQASDNATAIPNHYLPDTVISHIAKGKMIDDTVWHKVANFHLVSQLGDTVSLYNLQGKLIVMDYFFTSCRSTCPQLTQNMLKMQQSFAKGGDAMSKPDSSIVQFISFSVDPETDSAARLKSYADHYGIDPGNWWLLTGNRDSIYNYAFNELKVDKFDTIPINPDFVHTTRFVLIDKNFNVRGFYNGLDSTSLDKLSKDIGLLMLAVDDNPEQLPFDPVLLAIFFIITIVVVIIVIPIVFRKKIFMNQPLQPVLRKNDKQATLLIIVFSFVVFAAVSFLTKVKLNADLGFDIHIFALANAIINSIIAMLLLLALIAVKSSNYILHKRLMLTALILSIVFLVSYITHHLLAGEAIYGDANHDGVLSDTEKLAVSGSRNIYLVILLSHIFLAAIILPFILFTAYRALIAEYPKHKKLARITWPLWFYVAVTGPVVYWMIHPYYR